MATHSNILAWEIPWTEEPSGLSSPQYLKELDIETKQQQQQQQQHSIVCLFTTIYFSTYLLKDIFVAFRFGNYE